MMKKPFFPLLTALLVGGLSGNVLADGGAAITVSGTVRDNTCYVSPDSQSKQVTLGNVASRQFAKVGDGSPEQTFVINLEKCSSDISSVSVTFSGTQDAQNPQLLAIDGDAGSAKGIAVGIYDQAHTLLPMGQASKDYALESGQSSIGLKFFARYIATQESVSSGSAMATATFVIDYA